MTIQEKIQAIQELSRSKNFPLFFRELTESILKSRELNDEFLDALSQQLNNDTKLLEQYARK